MGRHKKSPPKWFSKGYMLCNLFISSVYQHDSHKIQEKAETQKDPANHEFLRTLFLFDHEYDHVNDIRKTCGQHEYVCNRYSDNDNSRNGKEQKRIHKSAHQTVPAIEIDSKERDHKGFQYDGDHGIVLFVFDRSDDRKNKRDYSKNDCHYKKDNDQCPVKIKCIILIHDPQHRQKYRELQRVVNTHSKYKNDLTDKHEMRILFCRILLDYLSV